jgi:tRNA nucleotidyltransferase (CCA-adding enzyme)
MEASREIDPDRLPERLEALPGIVRLREAAVGASAYLVGGVIRDLLLGQPRADLDLAVEGDVGELARALGGEVLEHDRFSTATVRDGDLSVDLATSRAETYPRPGALPEVTPAPIAEDLARRDFSINAMAVPLAGEPELIDPYGGVDDLRAGLLRVLHHGSFRDDPTRALRAARYAARLGFALEHETGALLHQTDLATVSEDRVAAELRRIAAEPTAPIAFELLADWGLLGMHKGAPPLIGLLDATLSGPPWREAADRTEAILLIARGGGRGARQLAALDPPDRPSQGRRLADPHSVEELAVARALGANWLDRYLDEWRKVVLEIDGEALIEAGVPEGPAVGRALDAALDAKLDGEVSGREAELARALEAAREG